MENEPGALSRVAGLFSARGYNIESLTVAPTEDPSLSRMTVVTSGSDDVIALGLCAGGASAITFLVGQLLAWRQLSGAGYFLASNPANSFFYLITAMHGLHLMGGLVALGRTTAKVWRGAEMPRVRLSVELCAIYWHFLLLVWLVLLGLLTGWTDGLVDICRQLLT